MVIRLFSGGTIRTQDPEQPTAEALVTSGEHIVFVGSLSDARRQFDRVDEHVDLAGGLLLPGFIDAHDHFATMAVGKMGVDLRNAVTQDDILDAIRAYVQAQDGATVLRGYGWLPASFENDSPRREWLDDITGDIPMVVNSADFHDLWFNTAAMRAAGIDAKTPDPEPNQYYVRDPDGTPTGHAIEASASLPILDAVGTFTPENIRASQRETIGRAPSYGITSYFEAGVGAGTTSDDAEPIYLDLIARDRAGTLDIRVFGTYWTRSESDGIERVTQRLTEWNQRIRSEHVSISHLKMWADGTLFSGGSLLLEPTCGAHPTVGQMTFSEDAIVEQLVQIDRAGFDMHIHVDGDGSARTVLNALERARAITQRDDARHVVAHNTVVSPADIPRYSALGVIANCTPLWGTNYRGMYADVYRDLLGDMRTDERVMPYGDLVRSGAVVTYGADLPGVEVDEIAPLIQIEAAVTRKRPGFPADEPFIPRQAVTVDEAVRAYTVNAAYQLRIEAELGSLTPGKRADLVWLAEDIYAIEPERIHSVEVRLTMMDGQITYRND